MNFDFSICPCYKVFIKLLIKKLEPILKQKRILILILISLLVLSCDNKTKVMDSKRESKQEAEDIEKEKNNYEKIIDSLNYEIHNLSDDKVTIALQNEFAEAEIYNILKHSYIDNIIIGSNELRKSQLFLSTKLGFTITEGKDKKNGISNIFIEFEDSSKIEIMSISKPTDQLASKYKTFLDNQNYGFQFSIRSNRIIELYNHFKTLSSEFSELTENKTYTTLSKNSIDPQLPFFFIQHHQKIFSKRTIHSNKSPGIAAVWLSTNNIKNTAKQFIDFGFTIVDTIRVGDITDKTLLLRNNNFEIILIQGITYKLSGLTILTNNLDNLRDRLSKNSIVNLEVRNANRGKSIFLEPQTTKSIWFEFLEK